MNNLGDIKLPVSLIPLMPELYLALAATFLLIWGVYRSPRTNATTIGMAVVILFIGGMFALMTNKVPVVVMNGMFAISSFTGLAKGLVALAGVLVLLMGANWLNEEGGRPFEFSVLLLLSSLGMMFMISANDLLVLYMGLEMSSLALYVMASFDRDHAKSSEAGLKYFVLGALASGMMLFGMSLVYGFAGATGFEALATQFAGLEGAASKGVIVGVILLIVGFCFKLSAVPFHMWAPDVYEGAPTPVTAFFATAPKIAAMALFVRLMLGPFGDLIGQWQQVIVFVSIASMLVGALAAIMQTNIKRLLAYSSIGHAGFMLMGLAAGNQAGVQAIVIYLALYIFMSTGAFGCVMLMKRDGKALEDIRELRGLAQTSPVLAIALAVFMFSLAGIPPVAGFFGKMYIVLAAVKGGLAWLAVIGVATSVVGCYYYLKIVKIMYLDEPVAAFDAAPLALRMAVAISALVTFAFFLLPTPLVTIAGTAAKAVLP